MKLLCECGWQGSVWEASLVRMYDRLTITCPGCGCTVRIRSVTETRLVYNETDRDGNETAWSGQDAKE